MLSHSILPRASKNQRISSPSIPLDCLQIWDSFMHATFGLSWFVLSSWIAGQTCRFGTLLWTRNAEKPTNKLMANVRPDGWIKSPLKTYRLSVREHDPTQRKKRAEMALLGDPFGGLGLSMETYSLPKQDLICFMNKKRLFHFGFLFLSEWQKGCHRLPLKEQMKDTCT